MPISSLSTKGQFVYQLVTEGAEKGGGEFRKFTTAIESVNKKFKETIVRTHKVAENGHKYGETISKRIIRPLSGLEIASKKYHMTQGRIRRGAEEMNATIDEQGKIRSLTTGKEIKGKKAVQGLTKANERFKMEMLSVMFFGMAISRTFGGMIKNVRELTGVYDMWGAVAIVSLLPFELAISKISNKLASLVLASPTAQMIVGGFIEGADIIGKALSTTGQISLGIFGIAKAWPTITAGATKFKDFIVGTEFGKAIAKLTTTKGIIEAMKAIGTITIPLVISAALIWVFAGAAEKAGERVGSWLAEQFPSLPGKVYSWQANMPPGMQTGGGWGSLINSLLDWVVSVSPTKQFGGSIGNTGLYQLHAGERVIPPGGFGGGGTNITVNANIASDVDIKKLGDRLATYMNDSFERQHMRRSI